MGQTLKSPRMGRGLCLALPVAIAAGWSSGPAAARACESAVLAAVREPAEDGDLAVRLACDLVLDSLDVITKRLEFVGEDASGATLDCNGATLDGSRGQPNGGRDMIVVRSEPPAESGGAWSVPSGIMVRGCRVLGSVRVIGLGSNGQAEEVVRSSATPNHTAAAQEAAPREIVFERMEIVGGGRIPFYVAPGATRVTLRDSVVTGRSSSAGLYLDAESGWNVIEDNSIGVDTGGREQIAIDGSAHNRITGNRFTHLQDGGIYVYRNCGEGGGARHQWPTGNRIAGNRFIYGEADAGPAVWLGSRGGWSWWCFLDAGNPYGSGADNGYHAVGNAVVDNVFVGRDPAQAILEREAGNEIAGNARAE